MRGSPGLHCLSMGRPRQRGNGAGSVYRIPGRPKPWAASVTVGWTLEGRPIRRARYASSEREAKAMLLEMVSARDHARPLPDDRMTVGKWLTLWIRDMDERDLRPSTKRAYTLAVRQLLPELGMIPLRKLRSPDVERALRSVPEGSRSGVRAVLSSAIKDAMRSGHVQTNEAALARVKAPRRGLPAPSRDDVRRVLAELETHRLHALYVLMAGTGLRVGEATGLRWEDIDLATVSADRDRQSSDVTDRPGHLTVRYQLQRIDGEHVLTDPKTDSSGRVAYLPEAVAVALRAHKARQAAERLRAGRKWRVADLVFTNPEGEPVAESTAQWVLAQACKRAGVRHVSPHDLRRFALTNVEERLGREAAQRLGGHTSPTMTERYISTTERMLRDAAEALGEAMG